LKQREYNIEDIIAISINLRKRVKKSILVFRTKFGGKTARREGEKGTLGRNNRWVKQIHINQGPAATFTRRQGPVI